MFTGWDGAQCGLRSHSLLRFQVMENDVALITQKFTNKKNMKLLNIWGSWYLLGLIQENNVTKTERALKILTSRALQENWQEK